MNHEHPHNRNNYDHDHHDDNDNHKYHNNHNKTTMKRRRIFVRQNLFSDIWTESKFEDVIAL